MCLATSLISSAATIVWTNTSGGNWNVAANWNPNQAPGASDTAVITNNGTYTVTVNVPATIAGLLVGGDSGTQTLANTSQTLTLNGPGKVNTNGIFTLAGTVAGTGDLTLEGTLTWTGGTISGSGNTYANGSVDFSGTTNWHRL